ncbi:MAG: hypothetical protein CM1200mP22_32910 [Dehalococcoidia bacterium]|nr:MAG: hypothetical protein CM1200mP22_32910 [Dehalococcoidia bacterium]
MNEGRRPAAIDFRSALSAYNLVMAYKLGESSWPHSICQRRVLATWALRPCSNNDSNELIIVHLESITQTEGLLL